MGLATFEGPHLLIMDEPTNHLDIDSRAALIQAINEYEGAVILVSHDRYLLEACADRLWLVADGQVKNFDGDMNEYTKHVLERSRTQSNAEGSSGEDDKNSQAEQRRQSARLRKELAPLRKKIEGLEERMSKFSELLARIDSALAAADTFAKEPEKAVHLSKQRAELEKAIADTENSWLELTSEYESLSQA